MQLALRASTASEDRVAAMASMAQMVASMASMARMALMVLASVAVMASMVWVTALKRRELSNEMLIDSPLKTWLCSSTKWAWEADGSRSSRRVDVVKVNIELMGSQFWAMVVTLARMASMVASMASMVLMAPRATMVLAPAALKAPMAGVSALTWSKLRNKVLVYHPEDLLVRRWSYNGGMITVVYELGLNSSNTWLCSTTILAGEDDGSRCSRRVDDVKVKKDLMGCQLWALVVTMAWVATMASMVWMA